MAIVFFLIVAGLMIPFWISAARPYAALVAVRIATVEARIILVGRPLLNEDYAAGLQNFAIRGAQLLARPGVEQFRAMQPAQIAKILDYTAQILAPVAALFAFWLAYRIWTTDLRRKYRRTLKLRDAMKILVAERPFLTPALVTDISKEPFDKGPWRIKHTFISFAIEHGLLLDAKHTRLKAPPENFRAPYYDAQKAQKVFEAQLGPLWTGDWRSLQPHQQAVFGLMAGLVCRARKDVIDADNAMAASYNLTIPKGSKAPEISMDFKPGIALAEKYGAEPDVREIARKHAYLHSVLAALKAFGTAKRSGEFSTAHFLWLRPVDRTLFYTLHQVGLEVANLEAAGTFVHMMSENHYKIPSTKPLVAQAVTKLKEQLVAETWLSESVRDWIPPSAKELPKTTTKDDGA